MKFKLGLLLFIFACNTTALFAIPPKNLIIWTQNTLLNTLSLQASSLNAQLETAKLHYSDSAWQTLVAFLGRSFTTIRDEKLSLHPKLLGEGNITEKGNITQFQYWQISQLIEIPELKKTMNFSVMISKNKKARYTIESVNVTNYQNLLNWPYWYEK